MRFLTLKRLLIIFAIFVLVKTSDDRKQVCKDSKVKEIEDFVTKINNDELEFSKESMKNYKDEGEPKNQDEVRTPVDGYDDSLPKGLGDFEYDYSNYSDYGNISINFEDLIIESYYETWQANATHEAADILRNNSELLKKCNETALRHLQLYALEGALIPKEPKDREKLRKVTINGMRDKFFESIQNGTVTCAQRPKVYKLSLKPQSCSVLECIWKSWHDDVGLAVKEDYEKMVELLNSAAKENGFNNTAEVWKLEDAETMRAERIMKKLNKEILPLYKELHAFVRGKILQHYYNNSTGTGKGKSCNKKPNDQDPIPAHLTGNLIGQEWTELEQLVLPYPDAPLLNFTNIMQKFKLDQNNMAREADKFFTSLGFTPMTDIFWKKSVFNATESEYGCHAVAKDGLSEGDYSISMCADLSLKDFGVLHHEMGHVVAFMESTHLPYRFSHGVNKIFHEGLGDSMALSVLTQTHLEKIFNLTRCQEDKKGTVSDNMTISEKRDINSLMRSALYNLPLIPYSFVMEKWRYDVFKGDIDKNNYNRRWWKLRLRHQGIAPPNERSYDKFDPGAIIHIALNMPYAKYFFSMFAQFQIHKALCNASDHKGLLHHCDIYQCKTAGDKLKKIIRQGGSKPTVDLLQELTGYRGYSAGPILEYYRPLYNWLKKENKDKGYHVGWNITK